MLKYIFRKKMSCLWYKLYNNVLYFMGAILFLSYSVLIILKVWLKNMTRFQDTN